MSTTKDALAFRLPQRQIWVDSTRLAVARFVTGPVDVDEIADGEPAVGIRVAHQSGFRYGFDEARTRYWRAALQGGEGRAHRVDGAHMAAQTLARYRRTL